NLDIIQDIPAIEATAEGKLRGGFSGLNIEMMMETTNNDKCINLFCKNGDCSNKECKNAFCSNKTTPPSTTQAATSTSTPTSSGVSLIGGSFSILGF
ncbi:MAG: hypothetical protein RRY07_09890, partial [Bacteroidaceae bacterium]